VAGLFGAQLDLGPRGVRPRILKPVEYDDVDRIRQDFLLAVAGQVNHPGRLARSWKVDFVVGPERAGLSGVLDPPHIAAEVRAGDVIHQAVAVDVGRQGGETVEVRATLRDVSDLVRGLKVGASIPGFTANDIENAVSIHVEGAGGLERTAVVDRVLRPPRRIGSRYGVR
jgi:hypothetical protein